MGAWCSGGDKDKRMPEGLKDKEPKPTPEPEPVPAEPEPVPAEPVPMTPEQLHRAAHPGPIFNTTLENAAQRSDPAGNNQSVRADF